MTEPLILGTRGSKLALAQANACADALRHASLEVEVQVIKTTSEQQPEVPLSVIDSRDVFTRQLDEALLAGEIDLAVHSAKDVPTEIPEGITLVAITTRHPPHDALVSDENYGLLDENGTESLPTGATVATSSVRRRALLLHLRPDLRVVEIRGNVDTRIRKMREGTADALLLAHAGLARLALDVPHTLITHPLFLPAVGQGALAVATVEDHPHYATMRTALNNTSDEKAVLAERAMLAALEGGCRMPVGAHATIVHGEVRLLGNVISPDGATLHEAEATGQHPERVGQRVARQLLDGGASMILNEIRAVRR